MPRTQQARRALAAKREAQGAVPNRNYTADAEKTGAFGGFEAGDFVREKLGKKEKSFVLDAEDGVADGVLAPTDPRVSSAARAAPVAGVRGCCPSPGGECLRTGLARPDSCGLPGGDILPPGVRGELAENSPAIRGLGLPVEAGDDRGARACADFAAST